MKEIQKEKRKCKYIFSDKNEKSHTCKEAHFLYDCQS